MAGKKDCLWVADQVVSTLNTYLSTELDTLETEYNDGITLEAVPSTSIFVAERQQLPSPPFITVIPDRTDTRPFSGESRYDIEFHFLTAAVVDGGNIEMDRLKRRCARYVRAVEEVLIDYRTLGGEVNDTIILSNEYAPMMSGQSGLIQEGQVSIRVETML